VLVGLLGLAFLGYAGAVGYMYFNQRALQYDPSGEVVALADSGLTGAVDVAIPVGDETINGWYQAPSPGKPLIIYYKGNSQSFSTEHERFVQFVAGGYGFLAFDYRGFPASPGSISETNMLADSIAAYD